MLTAKLKDNRSRPCYYDILLIIYPFYNVTVFCYVANFNKPDATRYYS